MPSPPLGPRARAALPGVPLPGALLLLAMVLLPCVPLGAQNTGSAGSTAVAHRVEGNGNPVPENPVTRIDELHFGMDPRGSLEVARSAAARAPLQYEVLWRAAREAVTVGMLARDPQEAQERYHEAERFARAAVEVNPEGVMGRHFVAVALGRQALSEGIRTRVLLAEEIRAQAVGVLSLDPAWAGAHHVLGRWHAEVQRLGGMGRFVARRLLGGDHFGDASWEAAEDHIRRAAELDPGGVMHWVELARIMVDLGREEEAREAAGRALELPVREPMDPLHHREAQEILNGLGPGAPG